MGFVEWTCREIQWAWRTLRGLPGRREFKQRYWAAVEPVLAAHQNSFSREDAEASLQPWLKSMAFSQGPLRDGWPWMPFPAIKFLETLLTKESRVFEFGAGGSSVFFSSRVGELVSVEHDPYWFEQTQAVMKEREQQHGCRWRGVLAAPTQPDHPITLPFDDPLSYTTSDETLAGLSFHAYATLIDEYPDQYFDVVLVDGRARPSCFLHAMSKVRFGGYVILDNAERESYAFIEETAVKLGFEVQEFWGPGPYNDYCWRTIFLRRSQQWFALNDLDRQLAAYLDFDNGVFVEAGANDGIRQSNSLHFESKRGWRGILVEAVPALYEECRRHRPHAQVVWSALASPEQVPGNVTIRYAGLMSVVRGGMRSIEEEDAHIDAGCEVQKLEAYETEAPCATLSGILDQCGISHVDLLSLDVEGFEAQALAGLDLSRHRPTYILVEARYRADVDARLLPYYDAVAELSHHDVLFRLREHA
ncbi:FkbM family methyltransferase [Burkholderia sp. lig30]|uniref:FkbM family methyltransferase n=1 Tax=Burkholderia sp. lig30 TaxID=1192124 RepID=UPI0013661055|nr:FkbM family methyltransferase [Burkholderia sp. lig30]